MKDFAAEMAKTADQNMNGARTPALETIALDLCYRQIGISAVAAAARYQGVGKNPAYAPAPTNWQDRTGDAAA